MTPFQYLLIYLVSMSGVNLFCPYNNSQCSSIEKSFSRDNISYGYFYIKNNKYSAKNVQLHSAIIRCLKVPVSKQNTDFIINKNHRNKDFLCYLQHKNITTLLSQAIAS